MQANL
ncbi:transketolase, C-terminal domain protein, partial [Vibrio cholerae HC-55B2]